jgi:hypothetical protein
MEETMRISLASLLTCAALVAGCNGGKDLDSSSGNNGGTSGTNQAPIANAGTDQSIPGDQTVTLSAAASSDPEGTALTYYWSFDAVPVGSAEQTNTTAFALNHSADAVTTSFTPDAVGTYVVSLVVRDAQNLASNPDYVIITVQAPSTLPVANAGADLVVSVGDTATLDGTRSYDPLGKPITYTWVVTEKPEGSSATLSDPTSATPSFTADEKGVYIATLIVNNGLASSNGDSVTITATAEDHAPVANAGSDIATEDCTTVALSCAASADPDGDTLTYFWEVQSKPTGSSVTNATFSDRTSATPTFYPDIAGTYVVSCSVSDGVNWATPDAITITAAERAVNSPPVVNAGADQNLDAGSASCEPSGYVWDCDECGDQTITLGADAVANDVDGDPLTYTWTVESGDATISSPNGLSSTVTLENVEPEEAGSCATLDYRFRLTVTDCTGAQTTDTVRFSATCCGVEDTSAR